MLNRLKQTAAAVLIACTCVIQSSSAQELLYAAQWKLGDYALVRIDAATGIATRIGDADQFTGLFSFEGRLFGAHRLSGGIGEIDPETGRTIETTSVGGVTRGTEGSIAIDGSGTIYSFGWNTESVPPGPEFTRTDGFGTDELVRVLVSSDYSEDEMIDGLAFDCHDQLYGYGQNSHALYRIDTETGALTSIGSTGLEGGTVAGLDFDLDDRLFLIHSGALYEVDTSTGVARAVGATALRSECSGLAFVGDPELRFSLDIGSDTEITDDRSRDHDEILDPGDVYIGGGEHGSLTGSSVVDDARIFGSDPPPNTGTPGFEGDGTDDGPALPPFDLDGYDNLEMSLEVLGNSGNPLKSRIVRSEQSFADSKSLRNVTAIALSFHDDDDLRSWTATIPPGRVPTDSPPDFGREGLNYEVVALYRTTRSWDIRPALDEFSVHADLSPPPTSPRLDDDDVDALDYLYTPGTYEYFSADDEATGGLNPGSVYELSPSGEVSERVTPRMLGLTKVADIDAFEFCWFLARKSEGNRLEQVLAILFSTGEDKPFGERWSGGVDPTSLYVSFMDGEHFLLARSDIWMEANIDGITVVPACYGVHEEPDPETGFYFDPDNKELLIEPITDFPFLDGAPD